MYTLNENDIYNIVQSTLNSLFRSFAFKDVRLDVGDSQLPITAQIKLQVADDTLTFHVQCLPKVDIRVSRYAETPEEIQSAVRSLGFKQRGNNNNNSPANIHNETIQDKEGNVIARAK